MRVVFRASLVTVTDASRAGSIVAVDKMGYRQDMV